MAKMASRRVTKKRSSHKKLLVGGIHLACGYVRHIIALVDLHWQDFTALSKQQKEYSITSAHMLESDNIWSKSQKRSPEDVLSPFEISRYVHMIRNQIVATVNENLTASFFYVRYHFIQPYSIESQSYS